MVARIESILVYVRFLRRWVNLGETFLGCAASGNRISRMAHPAILK
jgi:hypothetical protein